MLWLIASYFVMVFLIPLVLSALVSLRALPPAPGCPDCAGDTIPLLHRPLSAIQRFARRSRVEKRWCLECGWEGLTRTPLSMPAAVQAAQPTADYVAADYTETLDVRTISIDGRSWRVLLQCWNRTKQCYGRLIFVEPTGRLWTDAGEAFSGTSRFEVIGQALSVTDNLLTSRLRRILSEN